MSTELAKKIDESVATVIGAQSMLGFEKAFLIADAIEKLKSLLTPEYMRPIMGMQGNRMGFKVDKTYPEDVVKNCLIEAVLTGVQPFGNQFNIIAGNMYITKEGFGYLLDNWAGLDWEVIPELPRISPTKESAAVWMNINWTLAGVKETRKLEFGIKMDQYTKIDAIIGKATRKARAWLHNKLSGIELGDGDVEGTTGSDSADLDMWKEVLAGVPDIASLNGMEEANKEQIAGSAAITALFIKKRNDLEKPNSATKASNATKQAEMMLTGGKKQ